MFVNVGSSGLCTFDAASMNKSESVVPCVEGAPGSTSRTGGAVEDWGRHSGSLDLT